jgi:hypothetical protein
MLTATTLRAAVLAVHKERRRQDHGCARAVSIVLQDFGLGQEWEIPLRALCTSGSAPEVLRWAKGEKE